MSDEAGLYPYVLEATGVSKAFVQGGLNVQVLNNTQLSVRRCEFDRDAVLLPAWRTARLMAQAGLREIDSRYFLLLPSAAAPARAIERGLARLPLGAQYITCGSV